MGLIEAYKDKLEQEEKSAEHYRNWCRRLLERVLEYEEKKKTWKDTSHFGFIRSIFRK